MIYLNMNFNILCLIRVLVAKSLFMSETDHKLLKKKLFLQIKMFHHLVIFIEKNADNKSEYHRSRYPVHFWKISLLIDTMSPLGFTGNWFVWSAQNGFPMVSKNSLLNKSWLKGSPEMNSYINKSSIRCWQTLFKTD